MNMTHALYYNSKNQWQGMLPVWTENSHWKSDTLDFGMPLLSERNCLSWK